MERKRADRPNRRFARLLGACIGSAALVLFAGSSCGRADFDRAAAAYCDGGAAPGCAGNGVSPDSGEPADEDAGGDLDAGEHADAGDTADAGELDAGTADAGDAGDVDAGVADAGVPDAGPCPDGCSGGQICGATGCTCPASAPDLCPSGCTDLRLDSQHCGSCTTACGVGEFCTASACAQYFDAGGFNVAFVTSQAVVPGLLGGTVGADDFCQGAAIDAGLPGSYVALLGAGGQEPWSRLSIWRGWVRRDRAPVGDTFTGSDPPLLTPLKIDEHGNDIGEVRVAVGRYTYQGHTCGDWLDVDGGTFRPGYSHRGGDLATVGYPEFNCNQAAHLYCFGVGQYKQLQLPVPTARRVFVTTQWNWPVDGGIAAADSQCATEAAAAGLSGTFRAAIASSQGSAASRFDGGTWYLVNGVTVNGFLTSAGPDVPIEVRADGSHEMASMGVSTGATSPTAPASATCSNWTSPTTSGLVALGGTSDTGPKSFYGFTDALCASPTRVYCAEP